MSYHAVVVKTKTETLTFENAVYEKTEGGSLLVKKDGHVIGHFNVRHWVEAHVEEEVVERNN